ncbi:hypothetical protein GSI_07816 [Ganoderma sinense ZZ0214-1]|uniref:Uncharacterized protein n=1 Tax=Ganoderma sinense ZZ0214-1 TaxID=1077348 RepID=A0A2G8S802_9APHY|nr:hypothetical protein GSI_07816 [Ganoderma sinense ZZ0214-1]
MLDVSEPPKVPSIPLVTFPGSNFKFNTFPPLPPGLLEAPGDGVHMMAVRLPRHARAPAELLAKGVFEHVDIGRAWTRLASRVASLAVVGLRTVAFPR